MRLRPLRTLVELAVFVPIGLAAELRQSVPRLVESGRERVESRIAVARVIGEMAVKGGVEQWRSRSVEVQPEPARAPVRTAIFGDGVDGLGPSGAALAARHADALENEELVEPDALPIADYESLAASQVVARLPALSAAERDQVAQFEQANRRRRTVLGKLDQLQRA